MAILINPYRFAATGDTNPHWQEIGRTTLSGTATTINVPYTDKPYVKILVSWARETGATGDPKGQLGDSSADTGSNYARRISEGGAVDATPDTGVDYFTQWATGTGSTIRNFQVISFVNNASNEKLIQEHGCFAGATGSGSAPYRTENVSKWVETSAQAGYFSYLGNGTTFSDGAEAVVLGYDPADTTGTNAWEELGTTTLSLSSDTLDVSFTAKKYLMINWSSSPTGTDANPNGRCGIGSIDTGSNYAKRENSNGGTDSTSGASGTSDLPTSIAGAGKHYGTIFCVNTSGQEKLMIGESVRDGGTGAGSVPDRKEWVAKYTVTSGQINRWQIFNGSDTGGNDLAIGSTISVWGFD